VTIHKPGKTALSLHSFPWRRTFLVLVLLSFFGWSGSTLRADDKKHQEKPYALLFGTVWGPGDTPVYGVRVKIRRANDKKARWELVSDHHGEFAQRLPAGKQDYVIWADPHDLKLQNGKHLQLVEEARVHVDYDERVDTSLHLK
jgi:hypothetical protein